ncbi:MAG: ferritin-like domain-containing protein [Coleofasciculaceae cyanobacterium]
MDKELMSSRQESKRSSALSRRRILAVGGIAGITGAVGLSAFRTDSAQASTSRRAANDAKILNKALYYEHQAIWAYSYAAGRLSDSQVGQAVLAIALANQADHMTHRDTLAQIIDSLGGTPVKTEMSYDISSYIERGEGNVDSDVNIAKLALALETDAAIAYATEVSSLKTPELVTAGATIAATEAAHATTIRAAFISLGVDIDYVPAAFVSADTRNQWVLKV